MISKASIRNFKCLRDVQIDLERFTVFVGPNGSGKSSILQGLDLLCRSFRPEGITAGAIQQGVSRGSNGAVEVACESGGKRYRLRTHSPSQTSAHMPRKMWSGEGQGFVPDLVSDDWKPWSPEPDQSDPLPKSMLIRLEASRLIAPNVASPDPTAMAPDGTGLHSALASMALNDPDSWQKLQVNLRRIIPTIRRLRHTPKQPAALLFDTTGADSLPAHQVSEGTLLVLGLLAALHASSGPSLVLLDDLDRGLHSKAQKELISLLRGFLETNPDLQLMAATHSPYMLDCMATNEVRMTVLGEDGATICAALTTHPQYEKWKDEMAPGEMWSLFGENWMAEQRAPA